MGSPASGKGSPPGADIEEVEWQFDADDLRPVGLWLEGHASRNGLSVAAGEVRSLTDTYFDTADWRLYRAGYALRVRRREKGVEATMKSLAGGEAGLRRRREVSEPLGDAGEVRDALRDALRDAPGPVGERVRPLAGRRVLKPLFEIHTRRVPYTLALDGEDIGEVALDETEVAEGDGVEPGGLRRVEVEVLPGALPDIESFIEGLRAECGLAPATSSKFETGLHVRGLEPPGPPELGPTGVDASLTAGEAAFAVMREQFRAFLSHEGGARIGEDPEELHDMRVAGRRLRAAMRIFGEALPARAGDLQEELRHFARILGAVRDLDVQIGQLQAWSRSDALEDPESLGEIISVLGERRERARGRMLRALDSRRYGSFVEAFSEFLRRGPSRRRAASARPLPAFAPKEVRRRYRKVRKARDGISAGSPAEDYHRLRKRSRQLRYALEFLSGVYGEPAARLIRPLKDLQDVLGEHQDAVVAAARLRELRDAGNLGLSPRVLFAMGSISHRYEALAREQRERFPEAYGELKGKRWKKLEKALQKAST